MSEADRRYHEKHRERRNAEARAYNAAHPDKVRAAQRRARGVAGASGETREGRCPICLKLAALVCDHDHSTGEVRGWICAACNRALGALGDDLASVERAFNYLAGDHV